MTQLYWPLKKHVLTQRFGENPQIYKKFGLAGHNGLDFRTKDQEDAGGPGLTYVYAAMSGVVETIRNDKDGYGTHIRIRGEDGSLTIYGHLSRVLVFLGDRIDASETIGVTGNTGFSSGPHLHFELRPAGTSIHNGYAGAVDPLPFLTMEPQVDPHKESSDWGEKEQIWNKKDPDKPTLRQDTILMLYRYHKRFIEKK